MTALEFVDPPTIEGVHPNFILYGPAKSGKTTGAATAPGRICLLNADMPNASLTAHRTAGDRLSEVKIPDTVKGKSVVLETMTAIVNLAWSDSPPDSIIIDTVGELHRRLLEDLSDRAMSPSLPLYRDTNKHVERFVRTLCRAPVTVVVVGHEFPIHDANGNPDRLMWTGTKSSSESMTDTLMSMVEVIGYTAIMDSKDAERQYVASLVADAEKGRRGGDRYGVLGPWRTVNIEEWVNLIRSGNAAMEPQNEEIKAS